MTSLENQPTEQLQEFFDFLIQAEAKADSEGAREGYRRAANEVVAEIKRRSE